jgi:hypothetical protein
LCRTTHSLFGCRGDETLALLDLAKGRLLATVQQFHSALGIIKEIAVCSNGQLVASPCKCGADLLALDGANMVQVAHRACGTTPTLTCAFSPHMPMLAVGDYLGEVHIHGLQC